MVVSLPRRAVLLCKAARASAQSLCYPKVSMRMPLSEAASVADASEKLALVVCMAGRTRRNATQQILSYQHLLEVA